MAMEYPEEQLNNFDKATLVQLFLVQQSQLQDIDRKLQLLLEQEFRRIAMVQKCNIGALNEILKAISWLANRNIVMWRRNLMENRVQIRSREVQMNTRYYMVIIKGEIKTSEIMSCVYNRNTQEWLSLIHIQMCIRDRYRSTQSN